MASSTMAKTCQVKYAKFKQTEHGHARQHAGKIAWLDDEVVGFECSCGYPETLVLGIYADDPLSCPGCKCKLYVEINVKIMSIQ